jgi:lipoate-protein ligase A
VNPFIVFRGLDPPDLYRSLALESWLLDEGPGPEPVLFLWCSPPAVVMGKNQNPWRECNLGVVQDRGLLLARRETGGGAVYHDPANLNLCWAMPRAGYDPDRLHGVLVRALESVGVSTEVRKGGAVWAKGRKISGCAFGYRRDRVLHHATLLVNADLAILRAALAPPRVRVKTHAVDSIPAPVANLADLKPGLTVARLADALEQEARNEFGAVERMNPETMTDLQERTQLMSSREWIWHRAPRFQIELRIEGKPLHFEVHQGMIGKIEWDGTELPNRAAFAPAALAVIDRALQLSEGTLARVLRDEGWRFPRS